MGWRVEVKDLEFVSCARRFLGSAKVELVLPKRWHAPKGSQVLERGKGLQNVGVGSAAVAIGPHIVAIYQIELSLLTGCHEKMGRGRGLVREENDATRPEVQILRIEEGLIEWREPIRDCESRGSADPQNRVAIIACVESAVPGCHVEIARAVESRRAAGHPDAGS